MCKISKKISNMRFSKFLAFHMRKNVNQVTQNFMWKN